MPGAASVLELYYLIGASFSMPRFCLVAIQSSRAQASGSRTFSTPIVTGFGVDASSLDPGTSFRFEGRGRRGSVSHLRLDRVPV